MAPYDSVFFSQCTFLDIYLYIYVSHVSLIKSLDKAYAQNVVFTRRAKYTNSSKTFEKIGNILHLFLWPFKGLAESFETTNRPDTMEKMFTQILMKIVWHTFRSFKEKYFLEKKNVANFFFIFLTHFLSKNLSSPKNLKWKFCYTIFFLKKS